jgi:alkyl sulfatase BDS1-like metallo-beta-lactamase superfamily hydrolase
MGGADEVVAKARIAFDEGDYRWVVELLNHMMFAQPDHEDARLLQADAYEQLGYQSESGPWRDSYLMAALELRTGMKGLGLGIRAVSDQLTVEMLFDLVGIRLDDTAVDGHTTTINWRFTDVDEEHVLGLDNCALHHRPDRQADDATVTISTTKARLADLLRGDIDVDGLLADSTVDGDDGPIRTIFGTLDTFTGQFGIVEP